jgi:hypothetical protein
MAVAENHDLIPFDLLVSVEADVVAALLGDRHRAITMDDGHAKTSALVQTHDHDGKEDIKTTALPLSPKGAMDAGVLDLGVPNCILCDRQCLPLASHV